MKTLAHSRILFFLLIGTLLFLTVTTVYAQKSTDSEPGFPSLEPLFEMDVKATENLSSEQIIKYGLLFSGCKESSPQFSNFMSQYKTLEQKIVAATKELSDEQKAEQILTLLYENLLEKYKEHQTQLDVLFTNGTYNCVSSSLLYMAVATAAGLEVQGQKTPTHAFCSVYINGQKIDVETTNPYGYAPGRRQVVAQTENSTKYAVIPKKNYANRREVSKKMFVSLIGDNMCVITLKKKDYDFSVPMACTVYKSRLDDSDFAKKGGRETFDAACIDFSLYSEKQHGTSSAIQWLCDVKELYGTSELMDKNLNIFIHNKEADLLNAGKITEANELYENTKQHLSAQNDFNIQKMIFLTTTQTTVNTLSPTEALSYLDEQNKNPLAKDASIKKSLNNWYERAWVEQIYVLTDAEKYLEAANLAETALKSVPQSSKIKTIKKQCLANFDIDEHNKTVPLLNAGKYSEALKIIDAALQKNPTSTMLQNDKKRITAAMQNR